MIRDIINMLDVVKDHNLKGELTNFALGKNKIPESFNEIIKLTLLKKWQKK